MSLTIQYIILIAILAAIIVWIIIKLIKKPQDSACCGCALQNNCGARKKEHRNLIISPDKRNRVSCDQFSGSSSQDPKSKS